MRPPVDDNCSIVIVLSVLEVFAIGRCMLASNSPVDKLVASFDTIFRASARS